MNDRREFLKAMAALGIGAMAPATAPAGINPNNDPLAPAKSVPFGSVLGVWVSSRDRKVAKHKAQFLSHPSLHLFDDRVGGAAVRALVVAVLDERHRCICRTLDVVALLADR